MPEIPTELLNLLPVQLMSIALFLVILVWLLKAMQGIVVGISGWRKDEGEAAAKLRVSRDKELREAIESARDARTAEARWYGQWTVLNEDMRKKNDTLADLGKAKDALDRENAKMQLRLRLYEAFMESDVVSSETRASWRVFRKMSDAAKNRASDEGSTSATVARLPSESDAP